MEGLGKLMENGTSMSMLDGVLCTYKDDNCYVMLRGSLTPEGASITNKNSGVKKIYECAAKVKESPENSERKKRVSSGNNGSQFSSFR